MEEKNLNEMDQSTKTKLDMDKERESALEEEKRVKVLSPGMLVAKRFFRNKLAVTGMVILVVMFVFAFICALFSPYSVSKVFRKTEEIKKDYATALFNNELRYTIAEGQDFSAKVKTQFILAKGQNVPVFEVDNTLYAYGQPAEGVYTIGTFSAVAETSKKGSPLNASNGFQMSAEFTAAYNEALTAGESTFMVGDTIFVINEDRRGVTVGTVEPMAVASDLILDTVDSNYASLIKDFGFACEAQIAVGNGATEFTYDGTTYGVDVVSAEEESSTGNITLDGTPIVEVSDLIISPKASDIVLSTEFKAAAREAISENGDTFEFTVNEDGVETQYFASTVNGNIYITSYQKTELIDTFASPSKKHLLGTDENGMDLMTRLMYGGRVSLMVGFVVIFIEMLIGIIVGGIAGFFGGWVDMLLMRFVDLFNSIPYWPMLIIAGSVMDGIKLPSGLRIFTLMLILGFLGWTGIARIVRGQILTLREQEFMIACEANGIRTSRRIFKHLVPNVMPILIVQATMGLGSVIISEATLSFLGLGVKYPMASWGSIINAATDMFVMTNYWWMWVPAGFLILITVLGFNFVGDGLRDAFDPKMKR